MRVVWKEAERPEGDGCKVLEGVWTFSLLRFVWFSLNMSKKGSFDTLFFHVEWDVKIYNSL